MEKPQITRPPDHRTYPRATRAPAAPAPPRASPASPRAPLWPREVPPDRSFPRS